MSGELVEKSIVDKLLDINPRYIWLLFWAVIIIPTVAPIGLPVEVNNYTQDLYDHIESLEPGSKVLIWSEVGWDFWPSEYQPGCAAVLQHLVDKQVKLYFASWGPESPVILKHLTDNLVNMRDYKYGEDYIQFGFFAGMETAISAFAYDVQSLVQVDYQQGRPVYDFPMMEGIVDASSFDFLMDWGCTAPDQFIRQYVEPFNLPMANIECAGGFPGQISWYTAGKLVGFVCGIRGAAEYEKLIDVPRWGIAQIDAQSTTHLTVIALLIIANILNAIKMYQGGK
jgi:hypothetical protein